MPSYALASDFDGTIYFHNVQPQMRISDLEAIARLRASGGLFGLCTGRPYFGVRNALSCCPEAKGKLDCDFFIHSSGAQILDGQGRILEERCLSRNLACELFECCSMDSFVVVMQAGGRLYSRTPFNTFQIKVASPEEIEEDAFYGVSFYAPDEKTAVEAAARIGREYADEISTYHNGFIVDIVRKDVSKGMALKRIKEHFGVEIMGAIGDSNNDMPMLKNADLSFTFPYAPQEVQALAHAIVPNIAEAIRLLIETGKNIEILAK